MKIRRYLGSNTQEAILKVKMDLGNDAIILNTRKVRKKGLFSFFSKPLVEVLAAIDEDYGSKKEKEVQNQPVRRSSSSVQRPVEPQYEPVNQNSLDNASGKSKIEEKEGKISDLENKVNSMEFMLHKILDQMQPPAQKEQQAPKEEKKVESKNVETLYNSLIKSEVEPDIAKRLIDALAEKVGSEASLNESVPVLYGLISALLGKPETIKLREDGKPTVVIFVGPTGVGKTTTLAKVAANYALNYKKNVGFITADTYRIAAVEQLKTYAEILGMPVEVIYSIGEIKDAISKYSDKDLVLIDTAGRSFKNKTQFDELKTLVSACEADEVYLVLSATTSMRTCREIINNYSFIKNYKLIFTKIDEVPVLGIILNTKYITNKSLSYLTNGQSVPDDIELANIDKITKILLGSNN
ncbi:MAG TPA: flagellar biosynthesis protein FlhF [Clostridia bacterium]|nr:flagellar biosynthesis protein FlhF [Clostridia bacterium]